MPKFIAYNILWDIDKDKVNEALYDLTPKKGAELFEMSVSKYANTPVNQLPLTNRVINKMFDIPNEVEIPEELGIKSSVFSKDDISKVSKWTSDKYGYIIKTCDTGYADISDIDAIKKEFDNINYNEIIHFKNFPHKNVNVYIDKRDDNTFALNIYYENGADSEDIAVSKDMPIDRLEKELKEIESLNVEYIESTYEETVNLGILKDANYEDTRRRIQICLKLYDLDAGENTTFYNYPRKGVNLKFCKDEDYDMVTFSVIIDGKDVANSYDIHLDELDFSEIENGTFNELVDEKITLGEFLNDYEKKKEIERD